MSEGKAMAQAGHAFTDAALHSLLHPDHHRIGAAYAALRPGTKITLDGGSLARVDQLCAELATRGIPFVRIIDKAHVEPPDFDGSDILTAIGVGPILREQSPKFLQRLPLWRGGLRMKNIQQQLEGKQ